MDYLEGHVVTNELRAGMESEEARRRLGLDLVDALVEIHSADVSAPEIAAFVRPGSYLERQVRRFSQLWEINQTRDLPDVESVGRWLADTMPEPLPLAVVHGDYRLGNAIVATDEPRIAAVLDWEMGAVGDPRADVGYLLATYSEPGGEINPLGASPVTAMEDSRRSTSSSSTTRSEAVATSSRSPGSRRSRSGRRRCSARRSTAAMSAASSPPRMRTPPASS